MAGVALLFLSIPSEIGVLCGCSYEREAGAQFLAKRISLVNYFPLIFFSEWRLAALGLCYTYSFSLLSF